MNECNKRRRVISSQIKQVDQLPDAALVSIATFLPKISRLVFAAALTAPASSWEKCNYGIEPPEASKIICSVDTEDGCTGETLYIGYTDYYLESKFTDVNVGSILVCADALHRVKTLELSDYLSITGQGLEPLRGSIVLEQIILELESDFCPGEIIPILDSIIEQSRNSLKQLLLPVRWRQKPNPLLSQFLLRFNQMMNHRQLPCSVCTEVVHGSNQHPWINVTDELNRGRLEYGLQNYTCNDCKKLFCWDCEGAHTPYFCDHCQVKTCTDCRTMDECVGCNEKCCNMCNQFVECQDCLRSFCDCVSDYSCVARDCSCCGRLRCNDCAPIATCDTCDRSTCNQCVVHNDVQHCTGCRDAFCFNCLCEQFRQSENECSDCQSRIIPKLLEENDRLRGMS